MAVPLATSLSGAGRPASGALPTGKSHHSHQPGYAPQRKPPLLCMPLSSPLKGIPGHRLSSLPTAPQSVHHFYHNNIGLFPDIHCIISGTSGAGRSWGPCRQCWEARPGLVPRFGTAARPLRRSCRLGPHRRPFQRRTPHAPTSAGPSFPRGPGAPPLDKRGRLGSQGPPHPPPGRAAAAAPPSLLPVVPAGQHGWLGPQLRHGCTHLPPACPPPPATRDAAAGPCRCPGPAAPPRSLGQQLHHDITKLPRARPCLPPGRATAAGPGSSLSPAAAPPPRQGGCLGMQLPCVRAQPPAVCPAAPEAAQP